jgi:hypothetical protein
MYLTLMGLAGRGETDESGFTIPETNTYSMRVLVVDE